ncbi:hypothetical protein BYT27DRAFT_7310145 [Phlegmacium glaucopus]|nr:hypothetical protein BYT27DRAFT_7310145 [Phlegmacium glaucopus]
MNKNTSLGRGRRVGQALRYRHAFIRPPVRDYRSSPVFLNPRFFEGALPRFWYFQSESAGGDAGCTDRERRQDVKKGKKKVKVKTVNGKRGVNDSKNESFGIQDSGPSWSPSFKAPWPVPAWNSTRNNYGDDDDTDGGDEQDEITTTTNPTVPTAIPEPPHPPHNQVPNLDDMHAMADPKSVLMGNSLDAASSLSWSTATLYGPAVSMIDSVAVALAVDGGWNVWKESGIWMGIWGKVVQMETEEKRKRKEKENDDCGLDVEMMGVSGLVLSLTDDVSSATLPPATDELSNENNLRNITPSRTPLESQNDETFQQLMNTTSLSTLVDRLV